METRFSVIPDLKNTGCFTIHPEMARMMGIIYLKKGFVLFGKQSYEVGILTSWDMGLEEVAISQEIVNYLQIPLVLRYHISVKNNELHLGPFIGILAARTTTRLKMIVNNLTNYVYSYEQIGGAIMAFALDGVDRSNRTIKGYIFDPTAKTWVQGIFRYPGSIFKRVGMSKGWRNYFHTVLGNCLFNSYCFDKWEMYSWLSAFSNCREYLPDSILYRNTEDIAWLLKHYDRIYIKPIYGSQGLGIMEVTIMDDQLLIHRNKHGEPEELQYPISEGLAFLGKYLKAGKYILQQGISLISAEGRIIDFRLIILKNMSGEWDDLGMIARYGKARSIVSNISDGGSAELGEKTLKKVLGLNEIEVHSMRKRMSLLAIQVAQNLELCGANCGNLGIDMGIDVDGKLWLIEVNNKDPNHTIAIDAGDRQMFYRSKLMNMLYAKKLAGFGEEW